VPLPDCWDIVHPHHTTPLGRLYPTCARCPLPAARCFKKTSLHIPLHIPTPGPLAAPQSHPVAVYTVLPHQDESCVPQSRRGGLSSPDILAGSKGNAPSNTPPVRSMHSHTTSRLTRGWFASARRGLWTLSPRRPSCRAWWSTPAYTSRSCSMRCAAPRTRAARGSRCARNWATTADTCFRCSRRWRRRVVVAHTRCPHWRPRRTSSRYAGRHHCPPRVTVIANPRGR
jgi:hypothetical protein